MKSPLIILLLLACFGTGEWVAAAGLDKVEYDWRSVGNLGNPEYTGFRLGGGVGYGRVDYEYKMARTQVTNADYAKFLNSVATVSDPGNLYHVGMRFPQGGIWVSGDEGNLTYTPRPGWADRPVNYVNIWDSMRYANWINNGQPVGLQGVGTTESGSYTITAEGIANNDIVRNDGPGIFLPTEDEWFKAAYHEPGASTDSYWNYPTRSDTLPTPGVVVASNGQMTPGKNVANYQSNGVLANVGSAGPESESFYGISGMAGHVWEWTETLIAEGDFVNPPGSNPSLNGKWRAIMGGSRSATVSHMNAAYRHPEDPFDGDCCRGIRLVAIGVPEPSSALAGVATLMCISLRRRRRS